jgi:uncharacterized FlaG/YvyC family protein
MHIDSTTRIEGISTSGPERRMLPTKGQGGELQPHPQVLNPSAKTAVGSQATDNGRRELGQALEQYNISLKFTRDEETGTIVIEMIDQTSGETLLQFPNEARLHVAAALSKLQGKIVNCHA